MSLNILKIDHISRFGPEFRLYGQFLAGPEVDHISGSECSLSLEDKKPWTIYPERSVVPGPKLWSRVTCMGNNYLFSIGLHLTLGHSYSYGHYLSGHGLHGHAHGGGGLRLGPRVAGRRLAGLGLPRWSGLCGRRSHLDGGGLWREEIHK